MTKLVRKIKSKGRINIPKKIRSKFDTDIFQVEKIGNHIVLTPMESENKEVNIEDLKEKENIDFKQ